MRKDTKIGILIGIAVGVITLLIISLWPSQSLQSRQSRDFNSKMTTNPDTDTNTNNNRNRRQP